MPSWIVVSGHALMIWLPAYVLAGNPEASILHAAGVAALLTVVWLLTFSAVRTSRRAGAFASGRSLSLLVANVSAAVVASAFGLWFPSLELDPVGLFGVAVAALVLTTGWYALVAQAGARVQRVLVVGSGASTNHLLDTLREEPGIDDRFEVVGVVADEETGPSIGRTRVLGQVDDLQDLVVAQRPDLVVLAVERNRPEVFRSLLEVAENGFQVVGLPEFHEHAFGRVPVRYVSAAWFMSVFHLYQRPYTRMAKRTFDLLVAAIALVVIAPIVPLIALLVARTRGGIIYRQTRIGEQGCHFTMYKFRTMRAGAEESGTAQWADIDDPRVTRFGAFLRRTRLDELPQLWNVIRGEMSIVGPRPERPEFLEFLESGVPHWTRRHLLKPGITGWAQVRNGYAADRLGTEEKLCYDLWYLRHRSLAVDLIICAKTLPKLLSGAGAR